MKIIIFLLGCFTIGLVAQDTNSAKVSFLIGKVSVKSSTDTKWKSLKKNDTIENGDTVMTGNGSLTTILYKGSELKISPNSTIVVSSLYTKEVEGKIEVKNGGVWSKLVNLGGQKFTTVSPTSTAGVRGTAFATIYDEKSKVGMHCVCEGKVEVTSNETGGKSKLVEKGNGSSLKMGSSEIDMSSYKNLIVKKEAMPEFETKIKDSPLLKNCLSCHTPKGWSATGVVKDDKYGK
ncbi:MAG: FecR domain-containing protein [Leptospiraceae bacterium]|nr:FecR domain-containing protein [Leptospiraceae bacterium]